MRKAIELAAERPGEVPTKTARGFTDSEIAAMKRELEDTEARRQQVEHCFWQLRHFAIHAHNGLPFRAAQWSLNLGRAQELLGSQEGAACWWRPFERLLDAQDWRGLDELATNYIELLGLAQPSREYFFKL